MAEKLVSPGVFTRENDLSFIAQGVGEIGAAIVGPFKQGPAFKPTIITTQSELTDVFGAADGTYYTELTAQNYLREAGVVTICRVAGTTGYTEQSPGLLTITADGSVKTISVSGSATGSGYPTNGTSPIIFTGFTATTQPTASATIVGGVVTAVTLTNIGQNVTVTGSISVSGSALAATAATLSFTATTTAASASVGILFNTDTQTTSFTDSITLTNSTNTSGNFVISGSTLSGSYSASVDPIANNSIDDVFGTSPLGTKEAYVYGYFANAAQPYVSASADVQLTALADQVFSGGAQGAVTPSIQSQLIGGSRFDLFTLHTLSDGNVENTRFKVTIGNVKAAGTVNGSDYGTFSVYVRAYSDTDRRQTILEQYNNVNLDPTSVNYVARVIGDSYKTIDANGKITELGDWGNKSKYIRVEAVSSEEYPIVSVPFGHDAYTLPVVAGNLDSLIPAVTYNTGSTAVIAGINLLNDDNKIYLKPIPDGATTGANVAFGLDNQGGLDLTLTTAAEITKRQFTIAFQGGFDGLNPTIPSNKGTAIIDGANVQGFDLSEATSSGSISYKKCLDALSNVDEWDINLLVMPGVTYQQTPYVAQLGIDLCENRADAFFIMDAAGQSATIADAVDTVAPLDTNYAGVYYPWVKTIDVNTNKLIAVPPSVIMPAVYANNDRLAAEWFAPAGLNRGGLMGAVAVTNRLTHAERDELYEGRVNPIAQFPGQGISAYGQKTLQAKPSALDRINVRRLLITVKKYIASTSRYLVFEQNTTDTRNKFLNAVNPYLEGIQQKQGLYAFKVVMDDTNNTPDVIDRNIMKGAIFLQPTKTAEFIQIDFNILPTGASFNA
jgi:hypothetical protein